MVVQIWTIKEGSFISLSNFLSTVPSIEILKPKGNTETQKTSYLKFIEGESIRHYGSHGNATCFTKPSIGCGVVFRTE